MKRIVLILSSLLLLLMAAGCKVEIPEGDIKDFVLNIDYDKAYEYAKTGKSVITATYYVNDEIDGQVSFTTYFDNTSDLKYYYTNTDVSGSYLGDGSDQYPYNNQQILTYVNKDNSISTYKKVDNKLEDLNYTLEDVNESINGVFYSTLDTGYHSGGIYYGDYIYANCGKYYSCFSLNEEKNVLTYNVNTSQKNSEDDEIVTMHNFNVNEYGLIISLSTKSIYIEKNIIIHTTIECEYNIEIEKLNNL